MFALIGDPVEQARSPDTFGHYFEEHGIDAVLVPIEMPENSVYHLLRLMVLWVKFICRTLHQKFYKNVLKIQDLK